MSKSSPSRAGHAHAWENVASQLWETVVDSGGDGDGDWSAVPLSARLAEAIRQRRKLLSRRDYAQSSRRILRDMIRYVYLVVDSSSAMAEKDPGLGGRTRLTAALDVASDFVGEYYDQNPLSHLGLIVLRDGEASLLTPVGGNPRVHLEALAELRRKPARGELSLQNGLEVAGRSLGHMPRYGSREVVLIMGSLRTSDPGDILGSTLARLCAARVRVSVLSMRAEVHICTRLAEATGGVSGVCLDFVHLRDLVVGQCKPPPATVDADADIEDDDDDDDTDPKKRRRSTKKACEFVPMGFPTRETLDYPSLIHATRDKKMFALTGYICPRCKAKASDLPTDCAVCSLKLVLAPHLARSFHHLFPVPAFVEIPDELDVGELCRNLNQEQQQDPSAKPDNVLSGVLPVPLPVVSSSSVVVKSTDKKLPRRTTLGASVLIHSSEYDRCCYGCTKLIPSSAPTPPPTQDKQLKSKHYNKHTGNPNDNKKNAKANNAESGSGNTNTNIDTEPSLRFQCPDCLNVFCADCDAYLHETLHNCPGCLCKI